VVRVMHIIIAHQNSASQPTLLSPLRCQSLRSPPPTECDPDADGECGNGSRRASRPNQTEAPPRLFACSGSFRVLGLFGMLGRPDGAVANAKRCRVEASSAGSCFPPLPPRGNVQARHRQRSNGMRAVSANSDWPLPSGTTAQGQTKMMPGNTTRS
jgi:hypothetical protein